MARKELAETMELVGDILEIKGMGALLKKIDADCVTDNIRMTAIILQVCGLMIAQNQDAADRLISTHTGKKVEEISKMPDAEYTSNLKDAIAVELLGFFASLPHTGGQK